MNTIEQAETEWNRMTSKGYAVEEIDEHDPECSIYVARDNGCDINRDDRYQGLAPVTKALNIYEIMKTVSRCTGVPINLMRSPSRRSSAVRARWVAMYMARIKTQATLEEIGIAFKREHSSVIHGINTVKKDRELLDCVKRIQMEMF